MDDIEQAINEELTRLHLQTSENDSDDEPEGDSLNVTDLEGNLQDADELPDAVLAYVEASRNQMNALEQLVLEEEKDLSSLDLSHLNHSNNPTNEPDLDFMEDPMKWKDRVIFELQEQVALINDTEPQEPHQNIPNMSFKESELQLRFEWKEVEKKLKEEEERKLAAQEVEREMHIYSEREEEEKRRRRRMEFEEELKKTEDATMFQIIGETNEVHRTEDLQLELEKQQNTIMKLLKQVEEEKRVFEEAQEEERRRTQRLQCKAATKIQAAFRGTIVRRWSKTELRRKREEKKRREEEEKRKLEKIKKEREEERKRVEEKERAQMEEMEKRKADYERAKAQERHRLENEQRRKEEEDEERRRKMERTEEKNLICVKGDWRKQEEEADRKKKEKEKTEVESEQVEDEIKREEKLLEIKNKDNEENLRTSEDKNGIKQEKNSENTIEDDRNIIKKQNDKMKNINIEDTEGSCDTRPQTKIDENRIRSNEEGEEVNSSGDLDSQINPSQSRKSLKITKTTTESHINALQGFSNHLCPPHSSSNEDHPVVDVNPSIKAKLTVEESDVIIVPPDLEALHLKIATPEMETRGHQNAAAADLKACEPKSQELISLCLPDSTEQKRLAWMMSCTPWSKLSLQNKRKGSSGRERSQRAPRNRGAPSLPPLSEDIILKSGAWNSLRQVTTVTLEDLPGCSLSTLSECHKLQTLTLRRCGLTSLSGLNQCAQIRYIDVQENTITHVDCGGLDSLQVLLLGRNQLMNIHGLDGAENLQVLQLSHNNISRISGLGAMKSLLRLSVDHNQLLSTRGLKEIYTLLHLDCSYNHLSHIEGLENCALLNTLDLRGNSLTELPILQNHVLLKDLYLDDNLISSVHDLESYWLPLLQNLSMAQNSVNHLIPLLDFVSLRTLDVSHNCLSDLQNFCLNLQECTSLQELILTDNPLQQEANWRSLVLETVPGLIRVNNEQIAAAAAGRRAPEQQWCFQALCQAQQEQRDSLLQQQKMEIRSAPSQHDAHLLAIRHQADLLRLAVDQRYAHEYGDSCVTEDAAVAAADFSAPCGVSEASVSQEQSLEQQPQQPAHLQKPHLQSHLKLQSSDIMETQSEKEPVQALNRKIAAAVAIQRWRRRCMLRRREGLPGLIEKTNRKSDLHKVEETCTGRPEREHAAIVIQAVWRGCVLRKRLARALAAAQITESDEDFEEVDMDEFIFDEKELDKDWITLHSDALPSRMMPFSEQLSLPKSPPALLMPPQCVFPLQPKHAWSETGDAAGLEQSMSPNLSNRSVIKKKILSEKSEEILKEWGFTNDSTGLLMLKRANKMMGRKQQQKRFLVHQPGNEVHKSPKVQEKQTYKERSYQWLHTQAVHPDTDTGRDHFLPDIGHDILNGGRVQLVATGDRDAVDSGARFWTDSSGVSPTFRKQSQARRYSVEHKKAEVPSSTRVNSAPTRNERISFRDNPVRRSGGWGGGKKRARPSK